MAPVTKTAKPIFKTCSPFTETTWPEISQQDQEIILDLACNLLAPLGDHRRAHIQPSRGKKRKRKSKDAEPGTAEAPPTAPEIGQHILVGINSVTRHLETLAARNAPKSMPAGGSKDQPRSLSMIFLTHPKPSASPAHAHLPTLVHLTTLQDPANTTTPTAQSRLVPLATSADARLASALHIPRVGALAVFANAPGARALEDFVRDSVDVTECKWLDEAMKAEWRGSNIKSEAAIVKPTKKQDTKSITSKT